MGRRTQKVGVVGKYGTRYGANLRKRIKKIEISQHAKHWCEPCGRFTIKRKAVGCWYCSKCKKTYAGAAYTLTSTAGVTVRSTIRRLRELQDK
eukprot:NODE_4527_length_431_cov_462.353403_g2932_i1.p1 GENE.NODE_4527_length_431_cov_462.353403_g2932_i1~~NODE_4527_length_431_cov_462.353403_g2932_i1.p1  ORF type:complete len:93 (+),score=9.80 NODE_4527_length_431_cov_462.353403_g2932_i1:65-343(+)